MSVEDDLQKSTLEHARAGNWPRVRVIGWPPEAVEGEAGWRKLIDAGGGERICSARQELGNLIGVGPLPAFG